MAKLAFIMTALMTVHLCVEAFPNANNEAVISNSEENIKSEQAGPSLDSEQYRIEEAPEATDDKSSPGQRRKRFYNYFSFGFSPYDSFNPNFVRTDQPQQTGENGVQEPLSQILKRVQEILTYTKQQALNPPSISTYPAPLYVPVLYIPQAGCGCTPDSNGTPDFDSDTTATPTTNKTQPSSPANDNVPVTSIPINDVTKNPTDFPTRFSGNMGNSDDSDGARPISFDPIKPSRPLSRPPPPVQHGSSADENIVQNAEAAFSTTTSAPVVGVAAQPHLPTNSIPTLCDTAVLTCCHQPKVTVGCFVKQGCPDLSQYEEPCGVNVILRVINKFEFYYNNRRG